MPDVRTALFIGGTGTISTAITQRVAASGQWQLTLLNRGTHPDAVPAGVQVLQADVRDEDAVARLPHGRTFDCVCDFIGYHPSDVERDWRLFRHRTAQYIFISTASAYRKPPLTPVINEQTPLQNPYWSYSQQKIACEERLWELHRTDAFPVTVVRPSHTYCERSVPVAIHGANGSWQVLRRMMDGKPVVVHGDGTSLWTLTHSNDFAVAFTALMGRQETVGEAYQITSDESLTWNAIYTHIAHALGTDYRPCYVPSATLAVIGERYDLRGRLLGDKGCSVLFDNSKIHRLAPHFRTTIPFAEGAASAVRHILAHPELQRPDPDFDRWCDSVVAWADSARSTFPE